MQPRLDASVPRKVTVVRGKNCPHAAAAVAAVKTLADDLGASVVIEQVIIDTDEEARALRAIGSPTILINGRDIEPRAREGTSFGTT